MSHPPRSDFKVPRKPYIYYGKNLSSPLLIVIALQLFFAAIFVVLETKWNYGDAVYHVFVTATTVGCASGGSLVPQPLP